MSILPAGELIQKAKQIAQGQGLDPALICAVIEQESAWNQYSIRYEPLFFAKYVGPLYTNNKISATEAYARAFSWGLMQVMGQTARESGYAGPLPQLCDPDFGLLVGCKVLMKKLTQGGIDPAKGLLLWNGGANTAYPQQVLARMGRYQ